MAAAAAAAALNLNPTSSRDREVGEGEPEDPHNIDHHHYLQQLLHDMRYRYVYVNVVS